MNYLILFITGLVIGLVIGFATCHFLNIWIMREFGCEHKCTAQYNDKKHCMDCGKKLKTK